jgi:FkbM family methyltransferase
VSTVTEQSLSRPEIAEATLQGPNGPLPFQLFKTDVCFQIANDIFAGITYPIVSFICDVKTVVDIGANVGAASVYLATAYPQARIFALEPGSDALELLRANVKPLGNVSVFPFGLYSRARSLQLFHGKNDCVESSVFSSLRTTSEAEEIELRCASDFLGEQGIESIDVLKIDTEGCEVAILQSIKKCLPKVKVLYVEYHSERDRRAIDGMLADTHVLWLGRVTFAYRGEFCYVRRDLVPDEKEVHSCEILPDLEQ